MGSEGEGGVRERGGVRKRGGVRERGGSEVCSSSVGAHGRGHTWSWAHMVMSVYRVWACMGHGRVWVVGGVVVGRGRSSYVGEGLSCPWCSSFVVAGRCHSWVGCCRLCRMVICGWWGGGSLWSPGVVCGRWVSFVGAGCFLCTLGTLVGAGHQLG